MPSATTADSSDSIEPSSAKAKASGSTAWTFATLISGSDGHGSVRGSSPKRLPMVSTGRLNNHAATAVATTATRRPGHAGRYFRSSRMIAIVAAATATAIGLIVSIAPASACSFGTNALGSRSASVRPSRSLIWLAAMMTAMPAVKPTVTGNGMNLM